MHLSKIQFLRILYKLLLTYFTFFPHTTSLNLGYISHLRYISIQTEHWSNAQQPHMSTGSHIRSEHGNTSVHSLIYMGIFVCHHLYKPVILICLQVTELLLQEKKKRECIIFTSLNKSQLIILNNQIHKLILFFKERTALDLSNISIEPLRRYSWIAYHGNGEYDLTFGSILEKGRQSQNLLSGKFGVKCIF